MRLVAIGSPVEQERIARAMARVNAEIDHRAYGEPPPPPGDPDDEAALVADMERSGVVLGDAEAEVKLRLELLEAHVREGKLYE